MAEEHNKPIPGHIVKKITSGKLTRDEIFPRLRFWYGQGCDIQPYLHLVEPNAFEMIVNFTKAVAEAAVSEEAFFVPEEVARERLELCKTCPFFTGKGTCAICGCGLRHKVKLSTSSCPDKPPKWGKYVLPEES